MSKESNKFPVRKQYIGLNKPYKLFLYFVAVLYFFLTLYTLITALYFPESNFTFFWTPKTFPFHFPFEWFLVDQVLILIGKKNFKA